MPLVLLCGGPPAPPRFFDLDLFCYLSAAGLGVPIYPGHIPQGAGPGPAISYFAVSEEPYYTLARASGLTARVYQFSTWSTSYFVSASIERSLRSVLHGYRGFMGSTWVSSCRLQQCLDLPYEPNVDGTDQGTYQRAVEYRISFKEPIPILY
jgi:hypothetical protein